MRVLFRILRLLFRLFRITVLLSIFLAILALAYVRLFGFPEAFARRLVEEIGKKGVSVKFGKMYFDPFQGFVATDAVIFNPSDPDQALVRVDEIGLKINFQRWIQRQQALEELRIEQATISVPLDWKRPQQSTVTAKGVYASVRVEEGGIISVDNFSGIVNGVRLGLSGSAQLFGPGQREAKLPAQTAQLNMLTRVFQEFERIQPSETPELFVQFHANLAKPELSTARALLKTKAFGRDKLKVDSLQAQLVLENQVVHLQRLDIALYGGEINAAGDYDVRTGEVSLAIRSNTNAKQLAIALGPKVAHFFRDYEFTSNPIATCQVKGQPRELGLLVADGTMAATRFTIRGIPVQSFQSKFTLRDGIYKMPNFEAVRPEGTFQGTYTCRLRSEDFTLDAVSNLHPAPCRNIFPNHRAEFLRRFRFDAPPQVSFLWSGNWHDPEASDIKGHVHAGPFTIDGVPMKSLEADAELAGHILSVTNLVLAREEGAAEGSCVYDGQTQRLEGAVVSTANPYDLARAIGTNAVSAIAPYQFIQPPTLVLRGIVNFRDPSQTRIVGHVEGNHLYYWRLHADMVAADISIQQGYVALTNFAANAYVGRLTGNGEFRTEQGSTRYQVNCRVERADLQQIAESITRKKQKSTGQLSGFVQVAGVAGNLRTLNGAGQITIDKAVLWEHPVFGQLLSTILNSVLPGKIGTSTATNARGDFTLRDGVAEFSQVTVDAGMTSITASGRYKIWAGGLDFEVEGRPWNEVALVKPLTLVLMPFTKLFTMHLGGTWDNPEWRSVYLPKELLAHFKSGSSEKAGEEKPGSPAAPAVSDKPR